RRRRGGTRAVAAVHGLPGHGAGHGGRPRAGREGSTRGRACGGPGAGPSPLASRPNRAGGTGAEALPPPGNGPSRYRAVAAGSGVGPVRWLLGGPVGRGAQGTGGPVGQEQTSPQFREVLYSSDWNERTYVECLRRAEGLLFEGQRVLVDATF